MSRAHETALTRFIETRLTVLTGLIAVARAEGRQIELARHEAELDRLKRLVERERRGRRFAVAMV